MLLEKIKIKGFKSFADDVELLLDKGITAVVGPNGCGKSNIADSINWALGEQSPSSLRGKKMEQMIFNGSSNRKAMGMAEVTITLSTNKDLEATLDFDDDGIEGLTRDSTSLSEIIKGIDRNIAITRRMYRDSQSEYLLNGNSCRLKDIQDLLMALGIGSRAITIVEQDRIASIISSKPTDRRVIIEDAAGITKFKLNKHLTLLKLDHARNNLDRIEDLLGEQEIHVNSLKRQAAKTRRFRKLQDQIRSIESKLIALRHQELKVKHKEIEAQIKRYEEDLSKASAALSKAEAEEARLRQNIDELAANKIKKREEHYQSNLQLDRDTNRLKFLRDSIENLYHRSKEVEERFESSRRRLEERQGELKKLEEEKVSLQKSIDESSRQLSLLKEKADLADADLSELRNRRDELQSGIARQREHRATESSRIEALVKDEKRLLQVIGNSRAIIQKNNALLQEIENRAMQLDLRKQEIIDRLDSISMEIARKKQNLTSFRKEIESVDRRLETLKSNKGSAEATLAALLEMEQKHEGVGEAAKAVLEEEKLRDAIQPLGLVADFINIDSELTTPAVAAYRNILEAVVVETEEQAHTAVSLLEKESVGRAFFVVKNNSKRPENKASDKSDLLKALSAKNEIGTSLLSLFESAYLAADIDEAFAKSAENNNASFVTSQGHVIRNGVMIEGGGEIVSTQIFTRRERISTLNTRVAAISQDIDHIINRRDDLQAKEETMRAELGDLRKEAEHLRIQQVELTGQIKSVQTEKDHCIDAIAASEKEIEDIQNQIQTISTRLTEVRALIASLEKEIATHNSQLQDIENLLKQKSEMAGDARRQENELRTGVSTVEERLRNSVVRENNLKKDIEEISKNITSAKSELENIETQRQTSLEEIELIESGMEARVEKGKALNKELLRLDELLESVSAEHKIKEQEVRIQRKAQAEAQSKLEGFRIEGREQIVELQHLREKALENLNIDENQIEDVEIEDDEFDAEDAFEQLTDLKSKLDSMGAVNLLADEEYEKQLARFEKLQQQQTDVIDSIDSLEHVIDRIDKVSRKRFVEAFEQITANFHRIFRVIFQGGRAELILNEGDLLSAGIEIMVQPPGKRNQSAQLLSGGEKSLAAFALILAVMEYRPTPFCILDESDAALDESNVRRIASVIRERSEHTQFIVVTHNKTTMEIADRLYGVTMEEPGVSKLVSVQFN